MNKRDQIQSEAVIAIRNAKFKGIVHIAPRVGKTKIVIDSLNKVKKDIRILIVAPKKEIFKDWKSDIVRWKLRNGVTVEYVWSNSLKKITEKYDLIVADEIHDYNFKVLHELRKHRIRGARVLALTGTLDAHSEFAIEQIVGLYTIFEYNIDQAIADKIIADYEIICIGCEMSLAEKKEYGKWNHLYEKAVSSMKFKQMRFPMNKRKEAIYNSRVKFNITKRIIDKVDRCMIFTGYQKIANKLGEAAFHSKSDKTTLEKFKDGKIDKVAVVSMVSMGVTIPNLKIAIFNQLKSGENLAVQQAMRTMNVDGDKKAIIYIVYLKDTRDEVWLESALQGFNESKIKYCKIEELWK